jgi:hypothetical protein
MSPVAAVPVFLLAFCLCPAFGQVVVNKSVPGSVFSSEFSVSGRIDTIMKRLGDPDFLANIMGCVNRGGGSNKFARVGDAAVFAFFDGGRRGENGIEMLTFISALSEMRFTFQSMNGGRFFQDVYKFTPAGDNTTKILFTKRCFFYSPLSTEQAAEQIKLIEESLARLKMMMAGPGHG